ncbi:cation diffusion facilitator family transporter [Gloeobacter kilaueensis]|uniref:Cation diffusion facilitator family transporter n=1 Tax=Gloeobacter kilaueensis (strain ATCC BAA-2537 / CCAP 1431/1 / ULC 316 / JS1) TaxID=1183438 RepID=U5QM57_GLOK1|nr:cation diffusion facilitator family transporter [Gloeobacter kilaueensis]AGY58694.1 cation diffusion facilitator family transporter [Gloeobacter kilaueensis JS1]
MPFTATDTTAKKVQAVLWLTLVGNLLVLVIKAVLGFMSGSLSLLSDALHSLTDSGSNLVGLWAMANASPTPDREHPYGHQKFETIGALAIVAFLVFACIEILKNAVERIGSGTSPVAVTGWTLVGMIAVLAVNLATTLYERRQGEILNSEVLRADAEHTLSDVWVSVLVLVGLVGTWLGWRWLDMVLAFPVAAVVLFSAWRVLRRNLPLLVDERALDVQAIVDVACRVAGVVSCHDVASRGAPGRGLFIEMHMIVEPETIVEAHRITDAVEAALAEAFGPVRVTIHLEPAVVLNDPEHHRHLPEN